MARNDPALTNFNAGEVSPLLRGRVDVAKYANAVETLENFIPTVQGPARRRVGTQFMGIAPYQHRPLMLVPFIANTGAAFALEIGDHYTRFWKRTLYGPDLIVVWDDGSWAPPSLYTGGSPMPTGSAAALVTPWSASDLYYADGTPALKYVQSNDVMWLVHPAWFPVKIARIKPYQFTWTYYGNDLEGAPASPTVVSAPPSGAGAPPVVVTPPPAPVPGNAIRLQPNQRTANIGNSTENTVLIFNTGAFRSGRVSLAEYTGDPMLRNGVLSADPFGPATPGSQSTQSGNTISFNWFATGNPLPSFYPTLLPNRDYYITFTSADSAGSAFADNNVTA